MDFELHASRVLHVLDKKTVARTICSGCEDVCMRVCHRITTNQRRSRVQQLTLEKLHRITCYSMEIAKGTMTMRFINTSRNSLALH